MVVILRNDGGQRFDGISVDDFAVEVELFLGETYGRQWHETFFLSDTHERPK